MASRTSRIAPFIARHALARTTLSLLFGGAIAAVLFSLRAPSMLTLLGGWDATGLLLAGLVWQNIATSDAALTRKRAADEDPGRTAVYALVLITSAASLFASTVLVRGVKSAPPAEARALVVLCLLAVALSWTLTHLAFTLRYAHLYYREDHEGVGGVEFPGDGAPDYFDFTYLSFTIGMCFQVSDATISSKQIRRAVLLQATMSFLYNTVILAFVLNLAFGLA